MQVNIDILKKSITNLKYKWFEDAPNIIGIRTTLQAPDVFNDLLCCVWKEEGIDTLRMWNITTDPGTYWLNHPMNPHGTAVLKPGQYIDSYGIGFHKNDVQHRALVQIKPVTVYRDKDKDNIAEETGIEETGMFGLNIHRAGLLSPSKIIDRWSAACQVFTCAMYINQFLWILNKYEKPLHNKFTYTLLREKELSTQNV